MIGQHLPLPTGYCHLLFDGTLEIICSEKREVDELTCLLKHRTLNNITPKTTRILLHGMTYLKLSLPVVLHAHTAILQWVNKLKVCLAKYNETGISQENKNCQRRVNYSTNKLKLNYKKNEPLDMEPTCLKAFFIPLLLHTCMPQLYISVHIWWYKLGGGWTVFLW